MTINPYFCKTYKQAKLCAASALTSNVAKRQLADYPYSSGYRRIPFIFLKSVPNDPLYKRDNHRQALT